MSTGHYGGASTALPMTVFVVAAAVLMPILLLPFLLIGLGCIAVAAVLATIRR
jgi:hypothetical protein